MSELENLSAELNTAQPSKRKRSLPGMPDPEAEVIALSPKTLLATNRFVCEICNKGFQRDQNLQLHRRGHNLPWRLKQKTSDEVKKKVYVCPEITCVHHHPSRALGDLTGIKKHFCRKHGEKKYKCERCLKMYAVLSDLKAHTKNCGTREYTCDCGTLFSRRDSFVTHRGFCEALNQENSMAETLAMAVSKENSGACAGVSSPPPQPLTPSTTTVVSPVFSVQSSELQENSTPSNLTQTVSKASSSNPSSTVFASIFASSSSPGTSAQAPQTPLPSLFSNLATAFNNQPAAPTIEPTSLSLSTALYDISPNSGFSLFRAQSTVQTQPAMSATALLQKAAQMGASAPHGSLLQGLGLTSSGQQLGSSKWGLHVKTEADTATASVTAGLGLGLTSAVGSSWANMMTDSSVLGNKPTTLDLLGLGIGSAVENPTGGLSALLSSFGGAGFNATTGEAWKGDPDRKQN